MEQLLLLDPEVLLAPAPGASGAEATDDHWRLDDRTRAVGRKGLEAARRALLGSLGQAA